MEKETEITSKMVEADRLLETFRLANPRAFIQGRGEKAFIDGEFDLCRVLVLFRRNVES